MEFRQKVCKLCGESKPFFEFGNKINNLDGLTPHCKACDKERRKKLKDTNLKLSNCLNPKQSNKKARTAWNSHTKKRTF
jgi:hypothetical protein